MNLEEIDKQILELEVSILNKLTDSIQNQFEAMEKKAKHEFDQMSKILIPTQIMETDLFFKKYTLEQVSIHQNINYELSKLNQLFLLKIENKYLSKHGKKEMI